MARFLASASSVLLHESLEILLYFTVVYPRIALAAHQDRTRASAGVECGNNYESYFTHDRALLCGALVQIVADQL